MTSFLKSYNIIWCFYFWRVLLLIANPPLYDYSTLSPHISLSPHSFQQNWHDHKTFSRFYQILSPTPPLTPPTHPTTPIEGERCHGVLKRDFIWRKDVMNWSFVGTKKVWIRRRCNWIFITHFLFPYLMNSIYSSNDI